MEDEKAPSTPRPSEDLDNDSFTGSGTSSGLPSYSQLSSVSPTLRNSVITPARFASTSNAFGLSTSPTSSTSSRDFPHLTAGAAVDQSPPSAGTIASKRLRRPSLLSLSHVRSFGGDGKVAEPPRVENPISPTAAPPLLDVQDPSSSKTIPQAAHNNQTPFPSPSPTRSPFRDAPAQPTPRWGTAPFLDSLQRISSAPALDIEALSTSTPPIPGDLEGIRTTRSSSSSSLLDMDMSEAEASARSPLRWMPSHLETHSARRKGKARMNDMDRASPPPASAIDSSPFNGRPIPAPLLATLISETSPLEHEMRSEARLQRLIASHPRALPFTPRASRSTRGRFPETADDDDEDDMMGFHSASWRHASFTSRRRGSSSDSDSDDMQMEDTQTEPVNSAFAAGMDMDRPGSSSSSASALTTTGGMNSRSGSGSGPATANQPTPPSSNAPWSKSARISVGSVGQGLIPSPGVPTGLPFAFGTLGVGGTPQASPTVERLELVGSPNGNTVSSPSLLQYRESSGGSASVRPGKRKAAPEDRFDPYKRPRATSPAVTPTNYGYPLSPSRTSNPIPIPNSPSHVPFQSSSLSTPGVLNWSNRQSRAAHPYTRPMSSRSRQASPALSIGSTSGVLSTSLERSSGILNGRPSISLGQAFIATGPGTPGMLPEGAAPQGLGGLGLLSLTRAAERRTSGDEGAMEVLTEGVEGEDDMLDAMEED